MKRTISMIVKETRYKEIIMSSDEYDIPEDITKFVEFCGWAKEEWQDIASHDCQQPWTVSQEDENGVQSFNVEEEEE